MSDPTFFPIPLPEETNDKRPLPEIIADHYGFPLAYHDTDDGRFYAVQDWIAGIAQTDQPRKYWNNIKRSTTRQGIQLSDSVRQLAYRAANDKAYQMDFATDEILYQIAQRIRANTGLRDRVLEFLAKAGVVVDEIRIDPDKALDAAIEAYRRMGRTDKWITARIQGKVMRLRFVAAFRNALQKEPSSYQYALITDELRLGLWKRNSKALRRQLGLPKKTNVREHMSTLALTYEMLAESISAEEMEPQKNLKYDEAKAIVRRNSEDVGEHAARTAKRLGKDIATDLPLLE